MPPSSHRHIMTEPLSRPRRAWWLLLIPALLIGIALLVWNRLHRESPPTVAAHLTVTVAPVGSATIATWVTLIGTVEPREVAIVAAESPGKVIELRVEPGDRVEQGQLLARLDGEVVAAQVAQNEADAARAFAAQRQAQAQVAEAEAAEADAHRALARAETLDATGNASGETLDARRMQVAQAKARVAGAKAAIAQVAADQARNQAQRRELAQAEERLELRATVDGLVVERPGRLGAVLGMSEPLARIAVSGTVEIAAEIPEDALATLAVDQPAEIALAGSSSTSAGVVRRIDPQVDPQTRLGSVRIAVPRLAAAAGTSARVRVRTAIIRGLAVPASAVIAHAGEPAVVVIGDDGRSVIRPVRTGISDGQRVHINQGLATGERVVVRAPGFVPPGTTVRTVESTTAQEAAPWP